MRILHTADWHIGQTLNGWSRDTEHQAFLHWLGEVIREERIDALLVAGDIFDGSNPSGEAQRMLYAALAGWLRFRPGLQVVMIAGNHDPAARLEAPEAVLRELGVRVVGTLQRRAGRPDPARHLVPLAGPAGQTAAVVVAVPFLRLGDLPGISLAATEDGTAVPAAVAAVYAQLVAEACDLAPGVPMIGMGHLTCVGGIESAGAERGILIGGEASVSPAVFPDELGYVALGHLHRPQSLDGGRLRYAGSPFPLSATEIDYQHGATLVDLAAGAAPRHIPMPRPVAMLRVPARGAARVEDAAAELATLALDPALPVELRPFLHLCLTADRPATALLAAADAMVADRPVRLASLQILRSAPQAPAGGSPLPPSLAEITPDRLFARAFRDAHGVDPDPQHLAAFRDALSGI